MKKVCISYSTKDRTELSTQSVKSLLQPDKFDLWWLDGSNTIEGQELPEGYSHGMHVIVQGLEGGPDRVICYALTEMLKAGYEIIGLVENDCLLDEDWFSPTMALFDNPDGLPVGAVSTRSYEDRVLIQRDGCAVMHNVGAGHIILTREAAQIILDNYRTGWWPENRATFSQLSGLDIGKWGAFSFNEQMITADWSWDTILAAHGLATVALTPSKATMIGQEIPLEQQGLKYAVGALDDTRIQLDNAAFNRFRANLIDIREGKLIMPPVDYLLRTRNGSLIFPHHADKHCGIFGGKWTTRWNQGCGPFVYVAGEDASFSIPVFGPCAFHVGGGIVKVTDEVTGFNTEVDLTGAEAAIPIPRDMQYGLIRLEFCPGACFGGIETQHPQARMTGVTFDYSKLPPVEEKA